MKYSQFKVAILSNSGNKIQAKVMIAATHSVRVNIPQYSTTVQRFKLHTWRSCDEHDCIWLLHVTNMTDTGKISYVLPPMHFAYYRSKFNMYDNTEYYTITCNVHSCGYSFDSQLHSILMCFDPYEKLAVHTCTCTVLDMLSICTQDFAL